MTKLWPNNVQVAKVASGLLGNLVDMDFKFVLPYIYINFDIQTNFAVNQTQFGHSIPKNTPKNQYLKTPFCQSVIHQKAYFSYIFQRNLSESFRINVNMDFSHTNCGRFLIKNLPKCHSPKKPGSKIFWRPK